MAEERTLATARAPEMVRDDEPTKEQLQRRMEEARESITQTVNDIKETVANKYEDVRESISQTLDWREQYRRRPAAFTIGAVGVGALLGFAVGGVVFGGDDDLADRYYQAEGEYEEEASAPRQRSYAAQAITGGAYGSTASAPPAQTSAESAPAAFARGAEREPSAQRDDSAASESPSLTPSPAPRPSYSSGYEASTAAQADEEEGEDKPGLLARFKETKAYDRLQDELGTLGERAVEELAKTARNVVLPALLNKVKDMIGLDLSGQQRGQGAQGGGARGASTAGSTGAQGSSGTTYGTGTGGYGKTL
ncbi:MAG: hypothetical protein LC746_01720 [Acidobacteria bacterium]|nr:hypothetical protein [Acidobacteriota bacterium]